MQDDMVAELKAAGSSLPEGGHFETAAMMDTDVAMTDNAGSGSFKSRAALDGFEDLALTPRAVTLKQGTPLSGAKKKPGPPGGVKRGSRVGGRTGSGEAGGGGRKGRKKPGRPAGASMKSGNKKPTRTRLSVSDFDGIQVISSRYYIITSEDIHCYLNCWIL